MVENDDSSFAVIHKVLNFLFGFKTLDDIFYFVFIPICVR